MNQYCVFLLSMNNAQAYKKEKSINEKVLQMKDLLSYIISFSFTVLQ